MKIHALDRGNDSPERKRRDRFGRRRGHFESLEPRLNLSADWILGLAGIDHDSPRAGVETDAEGNVYVAGDFEGEIQLDRNGSPSGLLSSAGQRDGFVAKYTTQGDLLWARAFGGVGGDYVWGLDVNELTPSGNAIVVVTGSFRDNADFDRTAVDPSGSDELTSVGTDAFTLRLSDTGDFQWVTQASSESFVNAVDSSIDKDGNVYVSFEANASAGFGPFQTVGDGTSWYNVVAKLSTDGQYQWIRQLDNADGPSAAILGVDDHDADPVNWTVLVAANFVDFVDLGAGFTFNANGPRDFYVAKLDSVAGTTLAAAAIGGPGRDTPLSIISDGLGNSIVGGYFEGEVDFAPGTATDVRTSNGDADVFVLKLDGQLQLSSVATFGGSGFDSTFMAGSLSLTSAGDVLVTGQFEDVMDVDGNRLVSAGFTDGFVGVFDQNLNVRWVDRFGGSGRGGSGISGIDYANRTLSEWREGDHDDGGTGVAVDGSGNIYVSGDFKQTADFPTGDRLASDDGADGFLMKLDLSQPRVSGNIFADFNGNGVRDDVFREGILESDGWTVELVDGAEQVVATAVPLGNSGNYSFGAVPAGTYALRQVLPAGWTQTTPDSGPISLAAGDHFRFDYGNDTPTETQTHVSNDVGQRINHKNPAVSTILLSGSLKVFDINVYVDISHTFDADLDVFILSPVGKRVELFTDVGGDGDDFTGTAIDDEASIFIGHASAPFAGRFRPEGSLAEFDGIDAHGTWTLEIADDFSRDNGTLNGWSLEILGSAPPPAPASFSIDDVQVVERDSGSTTAEFTVTRSGDSTGQVSVEYATADNGSATDGADYVGVTTTTLTFAPGVTSLPINVAINGDVNEEPDETFLVNLSSPVGGTISDGQGVGTILDDDSPIVTGALFVYDIRFDSRRGGKDHRAVFEIRYDSDGDGLATSNDAPLAGVEITVTFLGVTYNGTTDADGVFRTPWIKNTPGGAHYANAVDLVLEDFAWDLLLDLEDDSDGDGKPDDLLTV